MTIATFKGFTDIHSNAKVSVETGNPFKPTHNIELSAATTREQLDALYVGAQVEIEIVEGKAVLL